MRHKATYVLTSRCENLLVLQAAAFSPHDRNWQIRNGLGHHKVEKQRCFIALPSYPLYVRNKVAVGNSHETKAVCSMNPNPMLKAETKSNSIRLFKLAAI